jgi:hypothetical protein
MYGMDTKECARCRKLCPTSNFWKNKAASDGLQPYCKPCGKKTSTEWRRDNLVRVREYERNRYAELPHIRDSKKNTNLKRLYGISLEEVNRLMEKQGKSCAICKLPFNGGTGHVDHCHTTDRVRGLLCNNCNNGLGRFMDNPEYLKNAITYLYSG